MSAPAWSLRRALLVSPIALYAVTIPLVNNMQVDRGFRVLLYQYRSYFIAAVVALAIIALVALAPRRIAAILSKRWYRQLLFTAAIFPLYYAAASVIKGRIGVPVIGLYAVWFAAVFFAAPVAIDSRERLRAVAAALLAGNAIAWLVGYYLFETSPPIPTIPGRESFGYANPNTYAQILQVIACCAAYLALARGGWASQSRAGRALMVGLCAACVLLVMAARSRNVLAFGLAASMFYLLLQPRRILYRAAVGAAAVASIAALSYADLDDVERYSSGRLSGWNETIDQVFLEGDRIAAFLVGTGGDLSEVAGALGSRYHDIRETASFDKAHFDNVYLELMVDSGLVGTLIFLLPYVLLFIMLWRLRRDPSAGTAASLGLALLVGFAVQGNFTPTIPSFNSPIGFMFALVTVPLAASARADREARW